MKVTALEEYGLRCLLRMAIDSPDGTLTVSQIAEKEGLTVPYVGKLMSVLRQSGLVESVRGRSGGYCLTRPAAQTTVEEILTALGEPLFTTDYCVSHAGSREGCAHGQGCSIRSVWLVLGDLIHRVLRNTSLADLCLPERELSKHLQSRGAAMLSGIGTPPVSSSPE